MRRPRGARVERPARVPAVQPFADPVLPHLGARHHRPGRDADRGRLDGLPDVHVRMAEHHDAVLAAALEPVRRCASPCCSGTRWSTSTPSLRPGPGWNSAAISAARRRRRASPPPRPRPAGRRPRSARPAPRRACPRRRCARPEPPSPAARAPRPNRRRCGRSGDSAARGRTRAYQRRRPALDQEAGAEREDAVTAVAVLEGDGVAARGLLHPHDRAAVPGLRVLDHQPRRGLDLRRRRAPPRLREQSSVRTARCSPQAEGRPRVGGTPYTGLARLALPVNECHGPSSPPEGPVDQEVRTMDEPKLDRRRLEVLRAIVEDYVATAGAGRLEGPGRAAQPRACPPATIRNDMAAARGGGLHRTSRTPAPAGCPPTRATGCSWTGSPTSSR